MTPGNGETMIRSIRPTDFVALAGFNRRAFPNEAKTRGNLGRGNSHPSVTAFLEQWLSLEDNRYSWVCVESREIKGLISARSWGKNQAWEIDRLLIDGDQENGSTLYGLLHYLSAVGSEVGMQKVFLRLESDSDAVEIARQAGFFSYTGESLYSHQGIARNISVESQFPLRQKTQSDDLALFQLYSASVPTSIRQAEAMTFQEWQAIKEKDNDGGLRRKEYVIDGEVGVVAWLRLFTRGRLGQLDLTVHPDEESLMEPLLDKALQILAERVSLISLVPENQVKLKRLLEERDFEQIAQYSSLVKHLAVRVTQPRLVPVRA